VSTNANHNRDSANRSAPTPGGSSQWLKSNLMGIGSAAVLAVYAAGFERTRAAAAKFNDEAAGRRRAAPIRTTGEVGALTPRTQPATAAPAVAAETATSSAPIARAETTKQPTAPTKAATVAEAPAQVKQPAPEPVATPAAPTQPAQNDSAPAPVRVAEVPAPVKPAAAAPSPDTAQTEKPQATRKDGTYTGWGTSRHGDIQATVQIKDGKIVFAAITECLTRYSCSWIAALPPQVLARQSADVDFVSGATESTNAFYYAVVEALNKAK
jgi:uncharacterized protein with FMN-binding domain